MDRRFGYEKMTGGPERVGWLLNMQPVSCIYICIMWLSNEYKHTVYYNPTINSQYEFLFIYLEYQFVGNRYLYKYHSSFCSMKYVAYFLRSNTILFNLASHRRPSKTRKRDRSAVQLITTLCRFQECIFHQNSH
jgi:hypothetical protein